MSELNRDALEVGLRAGGYAYSTGGDQNDVSLAAITAYLDALPEPLVNSKPNQNLDLVSTREELDKLPVGAVVVEILPDGEGCAPWIFEMDDMGTWMTPGAETGYGSSQINLPARVIYTPEVQE